MQKIETKSSTTEWSGSIDRAFGEVFQIFGQSIFGIAVGLGELIKRGVSVPHTAFLVLSSYSLYVYLLVKENIHLKLFLALEPDLFYWLRSKGMFFGDNIHQFILISALVVLCSSFYLGFRWMYIRAKHEKIFRLARLKNSEDKFPRIISSIRIDKDTLRMKIDPKGLGVSDFEAKKDQLEGLFKKGEIEEVVRTKNDQSKIEILFSKSELPKMIRYSDIQTNQLTKDHFVIGMSKTGVLAQDISELPHMLIAGMTGSGKSVFFKQVLMSLLSSTSNLKMYLIDLKGGLEMTDFQGSERVEIISNVKDAVDVLEKVKEEMEARFDYLKSINKKTIVPERDNKTRIVLGIDECSVLYMKKNKGTSDYQNKIRAREITDDIAKLSRAAGIHLILATQKVTKETIDTSIQDNIAAKVCFKMSGNNASVLVLGNKRAEELPQIRGRAIWHYGQDFIQFQAPLIEEKEIIEFCKNDVVEQKTILKKAKSKGSEDINNNNITNISVKGGESLIQEIVNSAGGNKDEKKEES